LDLGSRGHFPVQSFDEISSRTNGILGVPG
jgi:hypothetical protein